MPLVNLNPEYVLRAAPEILGPRDDGKPWTFDLFIDHATKLDFSGKMLLQSQLDRFAIEERERLDAERKRIDSSPVLRAREVLRNSEEMADETAAALKLLRGSYLYRVDGQITTVERHRSDLVNGAGYRLRSIDDGDNRKKMLDAPTAWGELTRQLEALRSERDFLAAIEAKLEADLARARGVADTARAELVRAQEQQEQVTQEQLASAG